NDLIQDRLERDELAVAVVLQYDEVRALDRFDGVDDDNVGVVEGRGGPRLPQQALLGLLVLRGLGGKPLDGNVSAEPGILSLVDFAHPALADLAEDAVVKQGLIGRQRAHLGVSESPGRTESSSTRSGDPAVEMASVRLRNWIFRSCKSATK